MRQKVDVVLMQGCPGSMCCVRTGIILLEEEVLVPLKKWHQMRLENLSDVPGSIDTISTTMTHILKDYRANLLIQTNGTPHHDACTSPSVAMFNDGISKTFCGSSPYLDTVIDVVQAKPPLVSEKDPPPVQKTPVDVILSPVQTVAAMLKNEGRTPCWNAVLQVCSSQFSAW
jgi:hypothetical protein